MRRGIWEPTCCECVRGPEKKDTDSGMCEKAWKSQTTGGHGQAILAYRQLVEGLYLWDSAGSGTKCRQGKKSLREGNPRL